MQFRATQRDMAERFFSNIGNVTRMSENYSNKFLKVLFQKISVVSVFK